MKVIDFRARPNIPEYAAYLRPRLEAIAAEAGRHGAYWAEDESIDEFVGALDSAGIDRAVFVARNRSNSDDRWPLTNDVVAEMAQAYPDRLVPFGGLDLTDVPAAVDEAERCVATLGFRGVSIDPFHVGLTADDDSLAPIYDLAETVGIAVAVTMGGMPGIRQPLRSGDPIALDEVAQSHPDLVLIGSHSGWPFTQTMIATAWRRPNVYFENSFYHSAPGAGDIVEAVNNGMIERKMLYASAYPFAPLASTLEQFRKLPFQKESLDHVLYGNATVVLEKIGVAGGGG